ncbi:hypothetical protein JTB14_023370 [Gonioctena quinquepunctata]|nr:hypothetical protein JTB14_023370 [Gonioctena quinquepunctata]
MIMNKLAPKITAKIEEELEKLSKQFKKMDTKLNNVAIKLNALDEQAHSNQKEVSLMRKELDSFEQTNKMSTLRLATKIYKDDYHPALNITISSEGRKEAAIIQLESRYNFKKADLFELSFRDIDWHTVLNEGDVDAASGSTLPNAETEPVKDKFESAYTTESNEEVRLNRGTYTKENSESAKSSKSDILMQEEIIQTLQENTFVYQTTCISHEIINATHGKNNQLLMDLGRKTITLQGQEQGPQQNNTITDNN